MTDSHVPRERGTVWQADVASIVLLVIFVGIVVAIERIAQPTLSGFNLVVTGILLAVIPAALWLAFFYRRDRLEPEPKLMVFRLFLLGGLLAAAVGIPLINDLFEIPHWLSSSPVLTQLLGGWLIVGMIQETLIYAAVRFTIYDSDEFDEETDGVVYATAAGIGYATVLNIAFVISSGGVALGNGAIRIVLTTLAHAAFAGVVGYFLGRQKFESRPAWWMPVGVLLAALINSVFFYLRGLLSSGSFSAAGGAANPWIGLILAVLLTAVVTTLVSRAIHNNVVKALGEGGAS